MGVVRYSLTDIRTWSDSRSPVWDMAENEHGEFVRYCDYAAQAAEIAELRKGLVAVRTLINESRGVDGLHLNGDVALWDELLLGGRFEYWLADFSKAEGIASKEVNDGQQ